MTRRVLILKGSPHQRGNSAVLAEQVAEGARKTGAEIESAYLHGMDIRPCDACELCHEQGEGCVIQDDMQDLYPKLIEADAIVLASPVYWFTYSAQLKLCIDRWYALESRQGNALRGKQVGIVLTYADTDLHTSGGINAVHTFESMFRYIGAEIVGIVHGTTSHIGHAKEQPELMQKAYLLGKRLGTNEENK